MTTSLWPHQRNAVDAAVAELSGGGRAQVIMACGTGKTLVAAETAVRLAPSGRVLICVPSLELLAQVATAIAAYPGAGRIIAVCSDQGATTGAQRAHTELSHMRAPVTTSPLEIAALATAGGRVTVLCTYQSLPALAAAHGSHGLLPWDLLIADEAHRTAGHAGAPWAGVLDDSCIPARRRLHLTATPRVANEGSSDLASMDDEQRYGREVFRLSFADAIDAGLLADYRLLVAVVNDAEVARLTEANEVVSTAAGPLDARMLAGQIALAKAIGEFDLRRMITYHSRVSAAARFAATLSETIQGLPAEGKPLLPIYAESINGRTRAEHRRPILDRLRYPEGATVVSNCRVLTEGVDVPALDGVMFADPRDSTTDVVQAVGRALRRGTATSKTATIVVPVFVGADENLETSMEGPAWAAVWRVVRALRAHDERLAHDLKRARLWSPQNRGGGLGLPSWLRVTGVEVGAGFANAVHLRLVKTVALWDGWRERITALAAYRDAFGHADPPVSFVTDDGVLLGRWLSDQRRRHRRGELPSERVAELVKFGVNLDPNSSAWQIGLQHAAAFAAEHGHLNVPMRYKAADGYSLGDWLVRQRQARRGTARSSSNRSGSITRRPLTQEQIDSLDALGMRWDTTTSWMDLLREYHSRHGHINVPRSYVTGDGSGLGNWLNAQRKAWQRGELDSDQVAELEELGMVWRPNDAAFEEGLNHLEAWVDAHGHAQVPVSHVTEDGYPLGKWLSRQRCQRRSTGRRRLTDERIDALEKLGMQW